MNSAEIRETLIDEFFTYGDVTNSKDVDTRIKRLKSYLLSNASDREIECILIMMQTDKEDYKTNNFEACKKMALPVFRLIKEARTQIPSFVEITILTILIKFAPTFEMVKECEKIIEESLATTYKQEKKHNTVKWMLSSNILPRLVRAKFPSADSLKTEGNRNEIDALFKKHLAVCKHVFSKNDLPRHEAFVQIWEGIFYTNPELIDEGLTWLRKNEKRTWYPTALEELLTYYTHLGEDITKNQFNILIGYRVQKFLDSKNVSIFEAADVLGRADNTLRQMISARRGISDYYLYKLSLVYDVDISYFFHGEAKAVTYNEDEKLERAVDKLRDMLRDASDETRKVAIATIKSITTLTK